MADNDILLSIGADTKSFDQQLQSLEKKINSLLDRQTRIEKKRTENHKSEVAEIKNKVNAYGDVYTQIKNTQKAISTNTLEIQKATKEVKRQAQQWGTVAEKKKAADKQAVDEAYAYNDRRSEILYKRELANIRRREAAEKEMIDEAYAYNERRSELLYKRKLAKTRRAEKAELESIELKAKAEYDNIKMQDKLNAEVNSKEKARVKAQGKWKFTEKRSGLIKMAEEQIKYEEKSAQATSKILSDLNKKDYTDSKKSTVKIVNFREELMINSMKKELSFYKKMNDYKVADTKKTVREQKAAYDKTFMGSVTGGTTFGHKVATTAQYATAGAGLYAMANALREVAAASIEYDNALFRNMAVLRTTREESESLLQSNRDLAIEYGMVTSELDSAAITLGRAGVSYTNLASATKVTAQLAKITGDTLEDSSKVVSTFTIAFGLAANEVEELGNQLAYAANASKLSIADLGTMANYAVSGAKALGLTKEEVLALSTAFSNVGVNASTIGTQIRKFGKLVRDDAKSSVQFFQQLGVDQQEVLASLKADDGGEAFTSLVKRIVDMNDVEYERATQGMEILTRQFLDTIRVTGGNVLDHYDKIKDGGEDLVLQSKIQAQSIEGLWNSAVASVGNMASGGATWIADLFTDRKELVALYETLQGLEKGTLAYAVAMEEVNSITGASTGTSVYKKNLQELGDSYVYLAQQKERYSNELKRVSDNLGTSSKEARYWAAAMGETGREMATIVENIEALSKEDTSANKFLFLPEPEHLLKVEELVNKILGVNQSAFAKRAASIKLLELEADKLEDIKGTNERGKAIQDLVEKSLEIELQYTKELKSEEAARLVAQEKKLKKLREESAQRGENQWNTDYDADFEDTSAADAVKERHLANMIALNHELNSIKLEGEIASIQRMETVLEQSVDFATSVDNMSDGLKGFIQGLGDITKAFTNMARVEKKTALGRETVNKKYAKAVAKIRKQEARDFDKGIDSSAKSTEEIAALKLNKIEEEKNLTEEQQNAQIDGYLAVAGAITGAVTSALEEGSSAAKAMAVIDSIGAIIKAWNVGYPMNLVTVPVTVAATASLLGQMGASAPSVSTPSIADAKSTDEFVSLKEQSGGNYSFDDFIKGLDGATKALERLGNVGTADSFKIEQLISEVSRYAGGLEHLAEVKEAGTTTDGGILGGLYKIDTAQGEKYVADYKLDKIESKWTEALSEYTDEFDDLAVEMMDNAIDLSAMGDSQLKQLIDSANINAEIAEETRQEIEALYFEAKASGSLEDYRAELAELFGSDDYQKLQNYQEAFEEYNDRLEEATERTLALKDRLARAGASDSTIMEMDFAAELSEYENLSDQKILLDIYEKEQSARIAEEAAAARLESQRSGLEAQQDALNDYLSEVTSQLSDLESVFKSLGTTIAKLRGKANGSTWSLNQFQIAMSQAMSSKNSADIQSAIDKSSALFNDSAFTTQRDKEFAQLVAANKFETLEQYTETEIDYLRQIEINTRAQVTTLATSINALGSSIASFQRVDYSAIFEAITGSTAAEAEKIIEETNTGTTTSSLADQMASAIESGRANLASSVHQVWFDYLDTATESQAKYNYDKLKDEHGDDFWGFANGGYTGNTVGIVHPNEYVLNAETSSKLGLNDSSSTGVFGQLVTAQARNNQLLNDIIMELKDSKDISNESLRTLQTIEEAS